jgi:hypothetical protein
MPDDRGEADDSDGEASLVAEPARRSFANALYIGTVILLVGLIILAYVLGLEAADKLASIFSSLVAVVALVHSIAEGRRARRNDEAAVVDGRAKRKVRAAPTRRAKAVVTATVTATVAVSCGDNVASTPDDHYSPYECSIQAGTPGTIAPQPAFAAGMVFCPVQVNDGFADITRPFLVSGQILGVRPPGRELVLFVRIDPETCDTRGRPGGPGRFLLKQVDFGTADQGWSYGDHFGNYPQGVTFGRRYEFATLSPASVKSIVDSEKQWKQSGIADEDMPPDFRSLSRFDVPPGRSDNAAPCG